MGNDGGSIANRSDLAKEKKKQKRPDRTSYLAAKAKLCALSQDRLQVPIVACKLGFLYNKDAILTHLIKKSMPKQFSHITSLKDVKQLSLHQTDSAFLCPITQQELNGIHRFRVMWDCGCVLSDKALQEIQSDSCLNCNSKITETVSLNQTPEEQNLKRTELLSSKKHKKSKQPEGKPTKRLKIVDEEALEKLHEERLSNPVYSSLFTGTDVEETFLCRNIRHGLR